MANCAFGRVPQPLHRVGRRCRGQRNISATFRTSCLALWRRPSTRSASGAVVLCFAVVFHRSSSGSPSCSQWALMTRCDPMLVFHSVSPPSSRLHLGIDDVSTRSLSYDFSERQEHLFLLTFPPLPSNHRLALIAAYSFPFLSSLVLLFSFPLSLLPLLLCILFGILRSCFLLYYALFSLVSGDITARTPTRVSFSPLCVRANACVDGLLPLFV
ncbi:hypothetical protein LSCM4_06212 [Leishmania orientalis]|uniref:Transmembrane protein n=1 Tax=Leishmania orientalis TaxID=2249476 RepID=A0A836HPA0_9TRYP|nr:hypothetical protein LSCM4_06212 [Leishmania orientalis]